MVRTAGALLVLLGIVGCLDDDFSPYYPPCTAQFVSVEFAVVDDSGAPVSDVSIRVELARTGEVLDVDQDRPQEGMYKVVDDSHRMYIGFLPERCIVTGTKDTRGFSAEFVIEGGRCHVHKVSGPESVVLE